VESDLNSVNTVNLHVHIQGSGIKTYLDHSLPALTALINLAI